MEPVYPRIDSCLQSCADQIILTCGVLHQLVVGPLVKKVETWGNPVTHIFCARDQADALQNKILENDHPLCIPMLITNSFKIHCRSRDKPLRIGWAKKLAFSISVDFYHSFQYHHTYVFQDFGGPNPGKFQRTCHRRLWGYLRGGRPHSLGGRHHLCLCRGAAEVSPNCPGCLKGVKIEREVGCGAAESHNCPGGFWSGFISPLQVRKKPSCNSISQCIWK